MKHVPFLVLAALGLLSAPPLASDASACGGCFHSPDIQQSESTQVTGHRMILSVSPQQSTLYDQIEYAGSPESFAWVLPVKGLATIGLSSDALLATLDELTGTTVVSPTVGCPPSTCGSASYASSTSTSTSTGGGVTVVSQSVVGPYETVQLSSTDPQALSDWLTSHAYVIPSEIQPIVDAYVAEGFDFLALRLVPGESVQAMRPVRVTTPGGSPALPLRMVAAGTGATTALTLWVIAEGRYEPANFASFTIGSEDLIWDWNTQSSNYAALRKQGFADANGAAWLVEAGEPMSYFDIEYPLTSLTSYNPGESGYGDDMGVGAEEELTADLETLFAGIDLSSLWVNRFYAELSKPALGTDLTLKAAASQTPVARFLKASATVGTAPTCPPDPCASGSTGIGASSSSGVWATSGAGGADGDASGAEGGGGCSLGREPGTAMLAVLTVLGLGLASRRRAARKQS